MKPQYKYTASPDFMRNLTFDYVETYSFKEVWNLKKAKKLTILTFAWVAFCFAGCKQPETANKNQNTHADVHQKDTSNIAVFRFDTMQNWIFAGAKPTELTPEDFEKIETILTKCINEHNREQQKLAKAANSNLSENELHKMDFNLDLKRYKRQYLPVVNSKGEKEVWINCLCQTWVSDWKTNLIFVHDGGNCYFNLKINLATGTCYDLMVNGDA